MATNAELHPDITPRPNIDRKEISSVKTESAKRSIMRSRRVFPHPTKPVSMLPDVESEALCTFCEQVHRWRPRQARWVEAIAPDDWIENQ
jgi:hypothetical protein